jgi:hypothetical protein
MAPPAADPQMEAVPRRVGGLSAVALGLSYVVITVLYVVSGPPPDDVSERLVYLADHTASWWGILALSVGTDILFLPLMWSLYQMLKGVDRPAMLAGTGLVGLFVVLDLAITWPNYSALITIADDFVAATDETRRTALLGAAHYAAAVLSSGLFGVYALLVPAAGIFVIGLVMRRGGFGWAAAYLGLATGVCGGIAVIGPLLADVGEIAAVVTAILTTIWVFVVGYRLLRPFRPPRVGDAEVVAATGGH